MTLPARSHNIKQPVPGNRHNPHKHRDDGSGSTSKTYHFPAKSVKPCPAPPPSPEPCYNKVPTVQFAEPEYRTINPDPRSIVVPSMGARSPMTGALSTTSSSLSSPSVSSRGSMNPLETPTLVNPCAHLPQPWIIWRTQQRKSPKDENTGTQQTLDISPNRERRMSLGRVSRKLIV